MKSALCKLIRGWADIDGGVRVSSAPDGHIHRSFIAKYADKTGIERTVFVKTNALAHQTVLFSEYQSLQQMSAKKARYCPSLHYPKPLYWQVDSKYVYLILTYHLIQPLDASNSVLAGQALARQHAIQSDKFGWDSDNHIGTTPQTNVSCKQWADFFRDCRLFPQLELAIGNGLASSCVDNIEAICEQVENLLGERSVTPCLLHGDLWIGNIGYDSGLKKPIFYDPAPYFGDPEADLAMTRLFGGFDPSFYQAYYAGCSEGAATEKVHAVYNLYHALNHFNLFGHNYQTLVDRLIYQTGFVS